VSASTFSRKYAIVGTAMINGPFPEDLTLRAAEAEAGRLAIEDAGLRRDQINGAILAQQNGGSGDPPTHADAFPRILGLPFNFYYQIGRGGAVAGLAIASALSFLDMGVADYVLVAGGADNLSRKYQRRQGYDVPGTTERQGYWGKAFGDVTPASQH